jgi:hypothetical protein
MAAPVTMAPARAGLVVRRICGGSAAGCAVAGWAGSGAMALTGPPGGPPAVPMAPVAGRVAAQARRFAAMTTRWGTGVHVELPGLLTARAAEMGWQRNGRRSVNGASRLVRGGDGWCAVTLLRPSDVDMVPALLGRSVAAEEVWPALTAWVSGRPVAAAVSALQELSIPAAVLGGSARGPSVRETRYGRPRRAHHDRAWHDRAPVVVDLSAMWAGPLAARLLGRAGARIVKVEDVQRPDGARRGPAGFYDDLHAGDELVRLDFRTPAGRAGLLDLVRSADIVIEASRPRALRRLGLIAENLVAERPGRTWVSITGYGRGAYGGNRVAFGDDAAVAGGLVAHDPDGGPVFCADAVADPLTGLRAASAAVASQLAGGGHLVDVSMASVCAGLMRPAGGPAVAHPMHVTPDGGWTVGHPGAGRRVVAAPRAGRPW